MLCFFILALILFLFPEKGGRGESGQEAETTQRLLLYMLPCDLETDSGAATGDLMELMRASGRLEYLEVIVFFGPTDQPRFPGTISGQTAVLRIRRGTTEILTNERGCMPEGTAEDDPNKQRYAGAASEESLFRFLREYGSDGANLIFWGHGCPGLAGIGFDRSDESDTLTLQEISAALTRNGLHFRLIGFDACGMASLEAAWMLSGHAELFAAYNGTEELNGWNYIELAEILPESTGNFTELLRKEGLQGAGRSPEDKRLTVIRAEDFLQSGPTLRRIFDTAPLSSGIRTLAEAADSCSDREAAGALCGTEDAEKLLLACAIQPEEIPAGSLPDIEASYNAFLKRK